MQSGSTGRNALRICRPVKQALELDPHGKFVARWLPVLGKVPLAWRFEPWKMPLDVQMHCGVRIGLTTGALRAGVEYQRAAHEQLRACQPRKRIPSPAAPAQRSRRQPPPPANWRWGFEVARTGVAPLKHFARHKRGASAWKRPAEACAARSAMAALPVTELRHGRDCC